VRPLLLVLTVIRNAETRSTVRKMLESLGHRVTDAAGFPQAQSLLSNGFVPDILLIESASTVQIEAGKLRLFLRNAPAIPTCLIAGPTENALRNEVPEFGIRCFLSKPVNIEELQLALSACCASADVPAEVPAPKASPRAEAPAADSSAPCLEELSDCGFFLAASPKMLEIRRQVKLIADADVNVLILGESGTGKEVVAHLIHKYSQRARHKFLKVNCAALPADLLESELFGHQKGAFTGAIKDTPGKFEQANHGTLLLDEIGEMSAQMQAKLLHVLQDGQFTRLGGQQAIKADLRVLAATNVHMESALKDKSFREDLYYRLSVFTISIPPLRERREEIPYLIEEIIRRSPLEMKDGDCTFSARLMDLAVLNDWPGNVRELRNFVTRTIIMRDPGAAMRELEAKIDTSRQSLVQKAEEKPEDAMASASCSGMRSIMRDVKDRAEAELIQDALEVSGWNRRHAAQYLNISYRGLLYKIQQHRLTPKASREVSTMRSARAVRSAAN
jgi:two-component system, NtrC family, response regulator AtoC